MTNWSDPQTLWLNLTNLGLGIATIIAIAAVAYIVVREIVAERKKVTAPNAGQMSPHVYFERDLGFTMADGGEPEPKPVFKKKSN